MDPRPPALHASRDPIAAIALLFAAACAAPGPDTTPDELRSPDGRVTARFALDEDSGVPHLVIALDGRALVRSESLGLEFDGAPPFGRDLEVVARDEHTTRDAYEHAFGKRRALVDHHRAAVWTLHERAAPGRTAELHVRVHHDAVSYRWRVTDWPGTKTARVVEETARHSVPADARAFPLYREHFRTSHEGPYVRTRARNLEPGRLVDLPFLLALDDGTCIAFTEADVRGFPHCYLARTDATAVQLSPRLSPRLDEPGVAAIVDVPFQTPWRVWMVGDTVGRLLESDVLLHLCPPPANPDTTWIVPGKQTWHWWNGTVVGDADEGSGMDFETMRAYVDFCARSGIRYHAITGQDVPWYAQSRRSVLPSPDADVLTPRPELRWDELLAHARDAGVPLRLWVHHEALRPKLEEAFALYERWGITGVMFDFLDRDDQQMVEFYERVLQVAGRQRLTVQFHGSFKPTGLQRTFPHLMNHEGSANLEVLKWAPTCDPEHDLIVPFTRGLAGPLDYHLGGFRAVRLQEFTPRYVRPVVLGTRARALAYYVVLENPLPMVCDYPEAYRDQPGFDFLVDVPTTWDESRVLSAEIGEHLVWARRKGARWYVGAITDWEPRELAVPLDFLEPGDHALRLLADPEDPAADPNQLVESRRTVTPDDVLLLRLASGGGAVAVIE